MNKKPMDIINQLLKLNSETKRLLEVYGIGYHHQKVQLEFSEHLKNIKEFYNQFGIIAEFNLDNIAVERKEEKYGIKQFEKDMVWEFKIVLEDGTGKNVKQALLDALEKTKSYFESLEACDSAWSSIELHETNEIREIE